MMSGSWGDAARGARRWWRDVALSEHRLAETHRGAPLKHFGPEAG